MSEEEPKPRSLGRGRASVGFLIGGVALLAGLGLRGLLFVGAPDVPRDDAVLFVSLALTIGAAFSAWLARPERDVVVDLGLWPVAGLLALVMPVLALFDPTNRPTYLPAGLECAGAVAIFISYVRLRKASALSRVRARTLNPKTKLKLFREGQSKRPDVPVASLVRGDRVLVPMEDELQIDGTILNGTGFVDESGFSGPGLPVAKKVGEYVYAGTRPSIPDLEIEVGAPQPDSLILARDRFVQKVGDALIEATGAGRAAALWVLVLGAGAVGVVLWRATETITTIATWLPGVAAVCVASAAAAPALSIVLGRIALLVEAKKNGLVVSRAKDVLALAHVRRWQIDPLLLAAPGEVEVVPLADLTHDTILAIAEALYDDAVSPEASSVRAALKAKKLESLDGAALKRADGVHYGTVNGRRWFLGAAVALEKAVNQVVPGSDEGTVDFLRERQPIVVLVGNDDDGIVGAIGIDVAADVDAKKAAVALDATIKPGLPDGVRSAVALAADVTCDGPPLKGRDATLLAEHTEAPSAGLRVRVITPRPGMPMREGAPRLFVGAIARTSELVDHLEQIASSASRRAWVATLFPPLVVAGLAFGGVLFPWAAGLVGLMTLVYAGRLPRAEDPPEETTDDAVVAVE